MNKLCLLSTVLAPLIALSVDATTRNTSTDSANMPSTLSYQHAITTATSQDVWQQGNEFKRQALVAKSHVASVLPEPTMSLSLANLGADNLAFNQQQMTQLKVGIAQQFARGDSLSLDKRRLLELSSQYPMLGRDRSAKLAALVGELWLRAYAAQRTMSLIEADRPLFEQLVELAQRSYQVGQGHTMQQDVVSAQLQLSELDDRLTQLELLRQSYQQQLHQWLPAQLVALELSHRLPSIPRYTLPSNEQGWTNQMAIHPAVLAIDAKQRASRTAVALTEQHNKIKWGVNGQYGWRDNTPGGSSRADLLSIGVTFDVPMFNHDKHRSNINAAKATTQVIQTDKLLLINRLKSNALALEKRLSLLGQRQSRYQTQLLVQSREQTQAVLSAYSNAQGDFSSVVLARVNELNRRIEAFNIEIEQYVTRVKLNYFLTQQPVGQTNE